jgi:hypothetical protein
MARNVYFSHGTRSEKHLYEDLIIEAMQIYGHDVYYIPRKVVQLDTVLNEDMLSRFESAFKIEMYVESVDGFEGDGKLMNKFGFEFRDQVTFVVANRRWNQLIGRYGVTEGGARPREGDLIYVPLTKGLFEIRYVEDKKPFYQAGQVPTFKLTCENFEYSNQALDTGVAEVDAIEYTAAQAQSVRTTSVAGQTFVAGETLTVSLSGTTVTGTLEFLGYYKDSNGVVRTKLGVPSWNDADYHIIDAGDTLTSIDSGYVVTIQEVYPMSSTDEDSFENDLNAQNDVFETNGAEYIDFSQMNPFGEPDQ